MMANEEPVFAEAVYRNLRCLEDCTYENLLHGGLTNDPAPLMIGQISNFLSAVTN
jgi:hypothetical protein